MKRVLFFAAALCCMSLWSCDNDQDLNELTPIDLEILELDELIASQTDFDGEALIADLCKGSLKRTAKYYYVDGHFKDLELVGEAGSIANIFFADGTCKECVQCAAPPFQYAHTLYNWQYDDASRTLTTYEVVGSNTVRECQAKVLYYNAEDHNLILEGDFFNLVVPQWGVEKVRWCGYIDVDENERTRILELCSEGF